MNIDRKVVEHHVVTSDTSQERVYEMAKQGHDFECPRCGHCCQQREWVGLTDEEIDEIDEANWKEDHKVWGIREFARAVEAKLKEKNA
jgi:predicted RNA-binding Zn-ribbon protein involved in translation (DUF1610 family)